MEVVLVVFDLVENLLHREIPFQRQTKITVPAVAVSVFRKELHGLHVLEICSCARRVFLRMFQNHNVEDRSG